MLQISLFLTFSLVYGQVYHFGQFAKSHDLSKSSWRSIAKMETNLSISSRIECASACNFRPSSCNAFKFEKASCSLAFVTDLEPGNADPEEFYYRTYCTLPNYEVGAKGECKGIDHCQNGGMYQCTVQNKSGTADKACINFAPGSSSCLDASLMIGSSSGSVHILTTGNRENYKETLLTCPYHGFTRAFLARINAAAALLNDTFLFICGGSMSNNPYNYILNDCLLIKLNEWSASQHSIMTTPRRQFSILNFNNTIAAFGGDDTSLGEFLDKENGIWTGFSAVNYITPYNRHLRHCGLALSQSVVVLLGGDLAQRHEFLIWQNSSGLFYEAIPNALAADSWDSACTLFYLPNGSYAAIVAGGPGLATIQMKVFEHGSLASWRTSHWVLMQQSLPFGLRFAYLSYLGRALIIWGGKSTTLGISPSNVVIMDWNDFSWSRDDYIMRSGGNEIDRSTFITFSSDHIDKSKCISARWPRCVKANQRFIADAFEIRNSSANTGELCANECLKLKKCVAWHLYISGECHIILSEAYTYADDSLVAASGTRYGCFYNWLE